VQLGVSEAQRKVAVLLSKLEQRLGSHPTPNPALNPVRFALWTLRDKAAPRRLALR